MFLLPSNFREPDESFTYLVNGTSYPIRKELRSGRAYWFLRKMRNGTKAVIYLGPVGSLSVELLDNAVADADMRLAGSTAVPGGHG